MPFLNWLLNLFFTDPTRDWLDQPLCPLTLDLCNGRLNQLSFGSIYEEAKIFGRPEEIERFSKSFFLFWYFQRGIMLEYAQQKLYYFSFLIGPDPYLFDDKKITFSAPLIESDRFRPFVVTNKTTKEQIYERFQAPEEEDEDEEETVWYYTMKQICLEFEFSTEGFLKRLNVYPKEENPILD